MSRKADWPQWGRDFLGWKAFYNNLIRWDRFYSEWLSRTERTKPIGWLSLIPWRNRHALSLFRACINVLVNEERKSVTVSELSRLIFSWKTRENNIRLACVKHMDLASHFLPSTNLDGIGAARKPIGIGMKELFLSERSEDCWEDKLARKRTSSRPFL